MLFWYQGCKFLLSLNDSNRKRCVNNESNSVFQRLKNVQLSLVLVSQSLDLLRLRVCEWKDMSNGPFLSFHNCELNFASVDILIKWTHLACPINFCPEY